MQLCGVPEGGGSAGNEASTRLHGVYEASKVHAVEETQRDDEQVPLREEKGDSTASD